MKLFFKITMVVIWMTVFFSCVELPHTNDVPVVSIDFTEIDTLSLRKLNSDNYLASYPEAMLLVDNELIVQDRRSMPFLFHKIGKDGVNEFVELGNGPEDYLDTNLNPFVEGEGKIGFYDPIKRKISLLKEKNGTYRIDKSIKINNIEGQVRESIGCGSFYLLTGLQGDFSTNRFIIVDSVGHIVSKNGGYPSINPSLFNNPSEDIVKLLHIASFLRISPDKQKVVFASYHGALIQFFDLSFFPDSLRAIRSLQLNIPMKHSQISKTHAGWVYGFEDVFATDNYVYAIFNGQTAYENPGFGHRILVFDWLGSLKKTYFSQLGIRSLAVDEDANLFYLAGYDEEEMSLYVASME